MFAMMAGTHAVVAQSLPQDYLWRKFSHSAVDLSRTGATATEAWNNACQAARFEINSYGTQVDASLLFYPDPIYWRQELTFYVSGNQYTPNQPTGPINGKYTCRFVIPAQTMTIYYYSALFNN